MSKKKKSDSSDVESNLKVVFAPGCFDHLDVESQEELDQLMQELTDIFANMTPEELRASSREVNEEMLAELSDSERSALMESLENLNNDGRKNRLQ